ncbi:polysaccharide deacetylase family protein [Kiloniella sp. b19]|uniref:polysaccharide deacetylase family protein n=1 Tax=Kiloniella sp. GXU_MW_B19 TaxID=3141326 RepID=UPI0031D586CD
MENGSSSPHRASLTVPDGNPGRILLYHSTFEEAPACLGTKLHNVRPEQVLRQADWLQQNHDLISAEEMAGLEDVRGKAAITFDDAYLCIFHETIPELLKRGIPVTVFVNSAHLSGQPFWRDLVRILITNRLEAEFLASPQAESFRKQVRAERLYRDSKKPAVNSGTFQKALLSFLEDRKLQQDGERFLALWDELPTHPLLRYGNHSHSHPVLSSLTRDEQEQEITTCRDRLTQRLDTSSISPLFAVPFGGSHDVNRDSLHTLQRSGCSTLLMSRMAYNEQPCRQEGVRILEREMAPEHS